MRTETRSATLGSHVVVFVASLALLVGVGLRWGKIIILGGEMALPLLDGWAVKLALVCAIVGVLGVASALVAGRGMGLALFGGIVALVALAAYALSIGSAAGDLMVPPGTDAGEVLLGIALGPGWYVSLAGALVMILGAARASRAAHR